jgi:hypothetical protein
LIARCLVPTGLAALLTWGVGYLLLRTPAPLALDRVGLLLGASLALAGAYLLLVLPFARGIGVRSLLTESGLPILAPIVKALWREGDRGQK